MVQLLRKKESIFKRRRANRNKTDSVPPIGTPSWCLNIEALEKFGRPTNNIPNYDPEDEGEDIEDIENENSDHESDNNTAESSRKKKRKKKQRRKEKQTKKSKKKNQDLAK